MRGPNNIDWNNETWDAQRLVREYIALDAWTYRGKSMDELVYSDQILFLRLIAVIHAFVGNSIPYTNNPYDYTSEVFSQSRLDNLGILKESPIDKADKKTIMEWLLQNQGKAFQASWTEGDITWCPEERNQMIIILLKQRFRTHRCLEAHDSWMEYSKAGFMALNACKSLYDPYLIQTNEQIDRIIALLLGSSFKGSFTVTELIKDHRYPKVTDEELYEWQIDNL